MKKLYSLILAMIIAFSSFSQEKEVPKFKKGCGTHWHLNQAKEKNTAYYQGVQNAQVQAKKWIEKNRGFLNQKHGDIRIPVVVHVVYNNTSAQDSVAQYISAQRIQEQIQILNEAYRMQNVGAKNVRDIFDTVKADLQINFELATLDPDCNPTDGILYVPTEETGFDLFWGGIEGIKQTGAGGSDAWPTDRYFNIWVGNLTVFGGEGLYGIATFPSNMPTSQGGQGDQGAFDGVAVYFEKMGVNNDRLDGQGNPFSTGMTLVHEAGHYFGLRHVWADEQGTECEDDDYVYDTPVAFEAADAELQGCNFEKNSCANENEFSNGRWGYQDPPDMIENYMDYSADVCYSIFTEGQKERVWSFMRTTRKELVEDQCNPSDNLQGFANPIQTSCPTDCDGSIEISPINGLAPYAYSLNGGSFQADSVFTDLCVGDYAIQIKDSQGSISTFNSNIATAHIKAVVSASIVHATCGSCTEGEIHVTVDYGVAPYSFLWAGINETTASITGLSPGDYTVTITDACEQTVEHTYTAQNTVGVNEISEKIEAVVAPNPASEFVIITVFETIIEQIKMLEINGKEVSVLYSIEENAKKAHINTEELTNGIYLIQITTPLGNVFEKLMVK